MQDRGIHCGHITEGRNEPRESPIEKILKSEKFYKSPKNEEFYSLRRSECCGVALIILYILHFTSKSA